MKWTLCWIRVLWNWSIQTGRAPCALCPEDMQHVVAAPAKALRHGRAAAAAGGILWAGLQPRVSTSAAVEAEGEAERALRANRRCPVREPSVARAPVPALWQAISRAKCPAHAAGRMRHLSATGGGRGGSLAQASSDDRRAALGTED
jgi:hypothetical protein